MRSYETGLIKVRKLTTSRRRAQSAWRNAIREAVAGGESLRAVAEAAGVTHGRVLQIVRTDPPDPEWLYTHGHSAVVRRRGSPKSCSRCNTTDREKVYEWANLTGDYANVEDYARMCRKCHRAFDRERRTQIVRSD